MPLPTIDLDTRRYPDLVGEALSLIPRHTPEWTNENASDPGITLLELFAFLTEQLVYRANRIPERHRRKFLELVGFAPEPPHAARTVVSFRPGSGGDGLVLPAGLALAAGGIPFRTREALTLTATSLAAVQVFDGAAFADVTPLLRAGQPITAFGDDPEPRPALIADEQPALYLGFDAPIPAGRGLSLRLAVAGTRTDAGERGRIEAEAAAAAAACAPPSFSPCEPSEATAAAPLAGTPPHHSVRTAWDVYDGAGWRTLDATLGEVDDETRGFTLDGAVVLRPPVAVGPIQVGDVALPACYVRCRLASGTPDVAPTLRGIAVNAVEAEQRQPVRETFAIAPGTQAPATAPTPGASEALELRLDEGGTIVSFGTPAAESPAGLVLGYRAATATGAGSLALALAQVGRGSGGPEQRLVLPGAPVADGDLALWTLEQGGARAWSPVPDFDASGRADSVFAVDAESGVVTFGDGLHGRVPPEGAPILARYDVTRAAAGNVPAQDGWQLAGADDELDGALLRGDPAATQAFLALVSSPFVAAGGAEAESLEHAAGRAAARLWSHERLVQLCADADASTLDQLDRSAVLRCAAPPRAATQLDLERLALDVPGTRISRARAFGGVDGRYPGLAAPGTVTVVVVGGLPQRRPVPSPALLDEIAGFLRRRKTLGTRLVVVGPTYVEVTVTATLGVGANADPGRVTREAQDALAAYLDPVAGGPTKRGWPFGRDVYRSELLQLLDSVDGVDHVATLDLAGPDGSACGNVCVPPTGLPVSGTHSITAAA